MKPQREGDSRSFAPKSPALACLVFAGLLAGMAVCVISDSAGTQYEPTAVPTAKAPTAAETSRGLWYIRLNQWSADARTLAAAVRYFLESDSQTIERKPTQRFPGLEVAMPTNSATVGPRA